MTKEEKRLINMMYDKKGNLTPIGKKVMEHRLVDEDYEEMSEDDLEYQRDSYNDYPNYL